MESKIYLILIRAHSSPHIAFAQVLNDPEIFIFTPFDDCLQSSAGYRRQKSLAG